MPLVRIADRALSVFEDRCEQPASTAIILPRAKECHVDQPSSKSQKRQKSWFKFGHIKIFPPALAQFRNLEAALGFRNEREELRYFDNADVFVVREAQQMFVTADDVVRTGRHCAFDYAIIIWVLNDNA